MLRLSVERVWPVLRGATALLLLLASFPPAGLAAVPDTGLVEGRLLDASGDPLAGVTVSLAGGQGVRSATTGPDGGFRFPSLPPGEYEIRAEVAGTRVARSARVSPGTEIRLDLHLGLQTTDRVDVTQEDSALDRLAAGVSESLTAQTAAELAFAGRNFQSSFTLFPATIQEADSLALGGQRPSTYGGQWQETAGFVDGVDTSNTRAGGGTRLFLPTTSLEEVRLHGAGSPARFGRSVGGVFNAVVKSGTSELKGTFLSILQSQRWRAQSERVPLPRDGEIRGSFEASVGGPIVRDHLWFFLAGADNSSNEIDALADGAELDTSLRQRSAVLKLSAQTGDRHFLTLTAIDAPVAKRFWNFRSADRYTPGDYDLAEKFVRLAWYTSLSEDLHLEVDAAAYRSEINRKPLRVREIDPRAGPASPLGNRGRYEDLDTGLVYNALFDPAGAGYNRFPRDQASVTLDWFHDRHSLQAGLDVQSLSWQSFNQPADLHRGTGYGETLPGGFAEPGSKRVFVPQEAPTSSDCRVVSLYLEDRFTGAARWTLRVGLQLDDQRDENDVGETVLRSTGWAPRLAATYDLSGTGKLLLEGTLGRTIQAVPLNIVGEVLARRPNGLNSWVDLAWNPDTQLYDSFRSFVPTPQPNLIQPFDPYSKDEVTLGMSWAPRPLWTATAHVIHWRLDDLYWTNEQFDEDGVPFVAIRNYPEGVRRYLGLELGVARRPSGGLTWNANYTLSRLEGNMFPAGALDEETLFEGRDGVDSKTGRSDATSVNRFGRGNTDRTHNLNTLVVRRWNRGRHALTLGGMLSLRSGRPWTPVASSVLVHPDSQMAIRSITFLEPRGSRHLPATLQVNLSASWSLPLGDRLPGTLGLEVTNLTNEQEQVMVNPLTGAPPAGRIAYEQPREVRVLMGFDF